MWFCLQNKADKLLIPIEYSDRILFSLAGYHFRQITPFSSQKLFNSFSSNYNITHMDENFELYLMHIDNKDPRKFTVKLTN